MMEDLFEKIRLMHNEYLLQHGVAPDAVLVPTSRIKLFADGCMVASKGQLKAGLVQKGLENGEQWTKIHDMWVYASDTAGDLMVVNLERDQMESPAQQVTDALAGFQIESSYRRRDN